MMVLKAPGLDYWGVQVLKDEVECHAECNVYRTVGKLQEVQELVRDLS